MGAAPFHVCPALIWREDLICHLKIKRNSLVAIVLEELLEVSYREKSSLDHV